MSWLSRCGRGASLSFGQLYAYVTKKLIAERKGNGEPCMGASRCQSLADFLVGEVANENKSESRSMAAEVSYVSSHRVVYRNIL